MGNSSKDNSANSGDASPADAPPSDSSTYSEGEKVLAYHGPRIYEAKVLLIFPLLIIFSPITIFSTFFSQFFSHCLYLFRIHQFRVCKEIQLLQSLTVSNRSALYFFCFRDSVQCFRVCIFMCFLKLLKFVEIVNSTYFN